ncbi:MAG: LLM class flavin-dependent oxidoreductase [Candidatus Hodarchaeota archaeon]
MKYGINIINFGKDYFHPNSLAELASDAETAGWDGFFLWDHLFASWADIPFVDPWIALSAIAVKTNRIQIGSMITPVARRRPWKLARETVSLDHLSEGRLILGVGLGNPPSEFTIFGEEGNNKIRAKKLDEGLVILTGLWSGKPFSYSGEYYQVEEITFLPKPVQSPRIPIWVGGFWPNKKPFQRAARWDGVFPGKDGFDPLTPSELKEILSYIDSYRPKSKSKSFDVMVGGSTPVDPEKGAEIVAEYIEAGATWWSEEINGLRGTFEEMRERIYQGPPKI